jgi:hypothetical protein
MRGLSHGDAPLRPPSPSQREVKLLRRAQTKDAARYRREVFVVEDDAWFEQLIT